MRWVLPIGNGASGWVFAEHIEAVVIFSGTEIHGVPEARHEVVVMTTGGQRLTHSKWETREAAVKVVVKILHGSREVYDPVASPDD